MSLALTLCALTKSLADSADISSFFFILSRRENILASSGLAYAAPEEAARGGWDDLLVAAEAVEVRDLRSRLAGEDVCGGAATAADAAGLADERDWPVPPVRDVRVAVPCC